MRRLTLATTFALASGCADIVGLQGINDAAISDSNTGSDSGSDAATDAKMPDGGSPTDGGGDAVVTGRKRIFYTSVGYYGVALGGIGGADGKCAAAVAGRQLGGTFKAWISDSNTNAIDRIVEMGPWYGINQQTVIFANKAALAYLPASAIVLSDNGQQTASTWWTGTDVGGIKTAANTCGDWGTVDAGYAYGTYGLAATTSAWTNAGTQECYAYPEAVLCIEQ